ncbi:hypothetical protein FRB90_008906 [Tulasnella sp. 427]|nr:hypothetical protein FRB90_008906 [Tulasnella sp. 427]
MSELTDLKCLIFDCYGTLVDWESGIIDAFQPLLSRYPKPNPQTDSLSRSDILKLFVQVENEVQTANPTMLYSDVLATAHSTVASSHFGVEPSAEESAAFGASVARWEPFPDTRDALRRLSKHYKLVILSNVDKSSFEHTRLKLEGSASDPAAKAFTFDLILTAQDIGSYKPDLKNFRYALREVNERWGVEEVEVCATAQSLFHDHVPARKLGLKSCWIERAGAVVGASAEELREKGVDVGWTWRFATLGEMADEVERAFGSA